MENTVGEVLKIKKEDLDCIIRDLKPHLPFSSHILGLSISQRLGVINHIGWFIRGKDDKVEAVMWRSQNLPGDLDLTTSVWGINLHVVQKLLSLLNYDIEQAFRALPSSYRHVLFKAVNNNFSLKKDNPHLAYWLSYEKYCELNKTWKTLPNPIEKDLKQGNIVIRPIQDYYISLVEDRWPYQIPGNTYLRRQIANYPSAGNE